MKQTDRRQNGRHPSDGGGIDGAAAAAGDAVASSSLSSVSVPMTRLDRQRPPPSSPSPPGPPSSSSAGSSPAKSRPHRQRRGRATTPSSSPKGIAGAGVSRADSGTSDRSSNSRRSAISSPGPNNVHLTRISSPSHLSSLPPEFLTGDADRPLLHVDESGHEYRYYLDPMRRAVFFILLVEMLERFSFYGINYTTTAYLTGEYNDDWNADMPSILASSYVSISTAVAYTTPFLGALLADNLLGEYMTMILATSLCYIPGLLLIALTTIPRFLGSEFNINATRWGLLALWPVGTGAVKACVNVFGAKQFHPILQSSLIESYYVNFYMCINIGALTGGVVVPVVAQWNVTVAYFIPVCMLGIGVLLFVSGTPRYVRPRPKHDVGYYFHEMLAHCGGRRRRSKRDRNMMMQIQPSPSESKVGITTIAMLSGLVVPFNVAYAQMSTTFIVQGSVMTNCGLVDAPMMNNVDALSILAFGYVIGNIIYPALSRRGIKIPTTYKFAIGSAFGAAAVGCAIATDYAIHRAYDERGEAITVLWQVFPYFLIGMGEIFAVSAAYELAFTVAPAKMKSVASAANLFMVGGLPNVFCIVLYNACGGWFLNDRGEAHIHKLEDYASARVVNYFWLLEGIALFGVLINVLPPVKEWVAGIEETAAETVKSPMSTPTIRKNLMQRRKFRGEAQRKGGGGAAGTDEETPLVRVQEHAGYMKYGDGPELRKMGSMRAGPSMKRKGGGGGAPPPSPAAKAAMGSSSLLLQVRNKLVPHAESAPLE